MENLFGAIAEKGYGPVFLEAGLPPPETEVVVPVADDASVSVRCGTCLEDVPTTTATRMDCGHAFCNECKELLSSFTSFCKFCQLFTEGRRFGHVRV